MPNNKISCWSSSYIAKGGMHKAPVVEYSADTQAFIKLLMMEQKMSMMQRNKITWYLRSGQPLPVPSQKKKVVNCSNEINQLAKTEKRRTFASIKASGDLDREKYVPKKTESREQKKIELQEKMSGFKHSRIDTINIEKDKILSDKPTNNEQTELTDELLQEVQERIVWFNEMSKLGEGHKYRKSIQHEIAERLRLIKEQNPH